MSNDMMVTAGRAPISAESGIIVEVPVESDLDAGYLLPPSGSVGLNCWSYLSSN